MSANNYLPSPTAREHAENRGLVALASKNLKEVGDLFFLRAYSIDLENEDRSSEKAKSIQKELKNKQDLKIVQPIYRTVECSLLPFYMKFLFDLYDHSIVLVPQRQEVISMLADLAWDYHTHRAAPGGIATADGFRTYVETIVAAAKQMKLDQSVKGVFNSFMNALVATLDEMMECEVLALPSVLLLPSIHRVDEW